MSAKSALSIFRCLDRVARYAIAKTGNIIRMIKLPVCSSFRRSLLDSSCLRLAAVAPVRYQSQAQFQATETAIPPPTAAGSPRDYAPKIKKLVDDISGLSLLEVSDLNELLKVMKDDTFKCKVIVVDLQCNIFTFLENSADSRSTSICRRNGRSGCRCSSFTCKFSVTL